MAAAVRCGPRRKRFVTRRSDDDEDRKVSKRPWSKEEDEKVVQLVAVHGAKNWPVIANHLPGRVGKQCRERYVR